MCIAIQPSRRGFSILVSIFINKRLSPYFNVKNAILFYSKDAQGLSV